MRDLITYLPYVYRTDYVSEILKVIQIELERYFDDLVESEKEYLINTSTYRLPDWAKFAGVEYNYNLSYDDNRYNIMATLRGLNSTTVERIKSIVRAYADCECVVHEKYPDYYFVIEITDTIGVPPNLNELINVIDRLRPAHLNFNIKLKYRTWSTLHPYTWEKLHRFTWYQVREKEGII